jgi:hypothetical protein
MGPVPGKEGGTFIKEAQNIGIHKESTDLILEALEKIFIS